MAGLSAKVLDSQVITNDKGKKVVTFTISVRNVQNPSESESELKELWQIHKLYSDFLALDAQLKAQAKCLMMCGFPKLPDKALFVTHGPSRVDQRKLGIENYLKRVIELPLPDTTDICEFLSSNITKEVEDESQTRVSKYRQGYLRKRGKNLGCWKKRFFVLDCPNLKYYESELGQYLGKIRLTEARIAKQKPPLPSSESEGKDIPPFQHALLIIEPKRSAPGGIARHILCGESDEDRDAWIEAMEQHIDYNVASKRMENSSSVSRKKSNRKVSPTTKANIGNIIISNNNNNNNNNNNTRANRRRSSLPAFISGQNNPAATLKRHSLSYIEKLQIVSSSSVSPASPLKKNASYSDDDHASSNAPSSKRVPWFKKVFTNSSSSVPKVISLKPSSSFKSHQDKNKNSDVSDNTPSLEDSPREPNQVFGIPLEDTIKVAKISEKYELPAIVYRCIDYLEAKDAIKEEGIYRRSGSAAKIRALKAKFNKEGDVDLLTDEETFDAHVISSLLKLWFRELPDNILTTDLLREIIETVDNLPDRRERVSEMGRIISLLPLANYTLLRLLCAHLIRVVQNAGSNKMTIRNVGIVFSATLGIPTTVFSLLLTEFDDIFWTDDSNFE